MNLWQLIGLALYSCAFPLGIYFESQVGIPNAFLLSLINLPFLIILWPMLTLVEPFHLDQLLTHFLAWAIIFAQSYLAFIHLRGRAETVGVKTSKALVSSLTRLAAISSITLIIGGLVLVLLFRLHESMP